MTSRVQFVEINVYEGMTPLVSGYLESYARSNPRVAAGYRFDKYATCRKLPVHEMLEHLEQTNADVYAFSCYVWNIGIVKALLPPLLASKPDATFVLGGPQVMMHADRYLDPACERMIVCNGEGERTFSNVLDALLDGDPDFSQIRD